MSASSWQCKQCTFSNHPDLGSCELCNWAPPRSATTITPTARSDTTNAASDAESSSYITCNRCSFNNDSNATQCLVCGDTSSFGLSYHDIPILSADSVKVKCPRCHVNLPMGDDDSDYFYNSCSSKYRNSSVTECPTCDFDLTTDQHLGNYQNAGKNVRDSNFESVTEGLIELISRFLARDESEELNKNLMNLKYLKLPKKITTEYALCSPCNHVSQRGSHGYEWSCGYRNIQMLCHSLLHRSDGECDYKSLLFNGKGDIPDVHGIQSWIEKAWKAGFDVAGGEEFGNEILGSENWIGATECVALLRYFRIRAIIVDFSMTNNEQISKQKIKDDNILIKKKRKEDNDSDEEFFTVKRKISKNSKSDSNTYYESCISSIRKNYKNDTRNGDYEDSDNDFHREEKNENISQTSNSPNEYNEKKFENKNEINGINNGRKSIKKNAKDVVKKEKNIYEDSNMDEKLFLWVKKYYHEKKIIKEIIYPSTIDLSLQSCLSTSLMNTSASSSSSSSLPSSSLPSSSLSSSSSSSLYPSLPSTSSLSSSFHTNTFDNDNNNDYNHMPKNKQQNCEDSFVENSENHILFSHLTHKKVNGSEREGKQFIDGKFDAAKETYEDNNHFILPLFFQHQGHSRTIIGYEISTEYTGKKTKIKKPDFSSLLVFDPLSNGLTIKKSLEAGNHNWKQQVKRGQQTLKKNSYQIVYIAKGIMTIEEQEKSKIIIGQSDISPIWKEIW